MLDRITPGDFLDFDGGERWNELEEVKLWAILWLMNLLATLFG